MNNQSKNWTFTWTQTKSAKRLPNQKSLLRFLNIHTDLARFQLEKGSRKGKPHFQGWFRLRTPRQSKGDVLNLFKSRFPDVSGLTLRKSFDNLASINYSTKDKGRLEGPWYCGFSEVYNESLLEYDLHLWHHQLLSLFSKLKNISQLKMPDDQMKVLWHLKYRGIIYIEDRYGGAAKTFFLMFLRRAQKEFEVRKLPVSTVDRLVSAAVKYSREFPTPELFIVDMPFKLGKSLSLNDLAHSLEEIKGGYLVDVMYGKNSEGFFDSPTIVIFSNHPLSLLSDKFVDDRLYHYVIEEKNNELGLTCKRIGYFFANRKPMSRKPSLPNNQIKNQIEDN